MTRICTECGALIHSRHNVEDIDEPVCFLCWLKEIVSDTVCGGEITMLTCDRCGVTLTASNIVKTEDGAICLACCEDEVVEEEY